jgi:hypothetical protein
MPKFYFNVRRDGVVYEDHEGEELSGRAAAWDWAIRDAQLLIDQRTFAGAAEDYWIEIVDELRRPLATVPLARLDAN